ncbi:LCCL domain-containing protein [Schlesneria sp. T3-172]|uniref:LCCL domain-containing protein n=1 Tax=Schlesneria sphaerica TaxID=3373610 RepID=UPI0037C7A93F
MFRFWTSAVLCTLIAGVAIAKEEIPTNVIAGKQVPADAKVKVGTRLVGIWDKKNYIVEVIELKRDGQIRIHWVGFDKSDDVDVSPNELYFIADTTPTRKSKTSALPKEFQAYDKNGDGQIGLYEWDRARFTEFRKLDKNNDHFLTPQELASKSTPVSTEAVATTKEVTPAATKPTAAGATEAAEDPGNLEQYIGMIDQTFQFNLVGKTDGRVFGTGTYTTSSDLATAAVHAGVLKEGEKGTVSVSIIKSPEMFEGSTANGVTSSDGSEYTAAYTIK